MFNNSEKSRRCAIKLNEMVSNIRWLSGDIGENFSEFILQLRTEAYIRHLQMRYYLDLMKLSRDMR